MGQDDSVVEKQSLEARKAALEREERELDSKRRKIQDEINQVNAQLDVVNQVIAEKNKFKQDAEALRKQGAQGIDLVKQVHALNLRAEQ